MPVSTLACDNVKIWENGRMYAYEGVSFCLGTCGHVYNFAAAAARLFPELERSVRLKQDLELAFDPASGRVNFRGANGADPEHDWAYASDAQSGYVLKLYREHLMSPDNAFLDEVWPKVKRVIGYMIFHDGATRGVEPNGVIEDFQTFWDPMWFGPNPYNNTLYLAALRAAGVPFRFATNITRMSRDGIVDWLAGLGITIAADECLTAPMAAAERLRADGTRRILPLLYPGTLEELAGFDHVEHGHVGDVGCLQRDIGVRDHEQRPDRQRHVRHGDRQSV